MRGRWASHPATLRRPRNRRYSRQVGLRRAAGWPGCVRRGRPPDRLSRESALAADRLAGLDRFRLGIATDIPLPGETAGKRRAIEKWTERNTSISVSFGYALTVTPLQLAAAYCSLVNGGYYYRPRLLDRRGGEEMPRELISRPITEATSQRIREILHRVVEGGTARFLKIPGLPYGGKTGTAALSRGKRDLPSF